MKTSFFGGGWIGIETCKIVVLAYEGTVLKSDFSFCLKEWMSHGVIVCERQFFGVHVEFELLKLFICHI